MSSYDQIKATKNILDSISPTLCAAKWTQVTLHLESGHNHSCHHPQTHLTPLSELKENPAALHNTQFKLDRRKEMVDGVRPKECVYCWNVEDLKKESIPSDRILKSSQDWSLPYIQEIVNDPFKKTYLPSYLEISFSNVCNLKCSYCSANFSSSWKKELDRFGPYMTQSGQPTNPILQEEENPYISAFWEWWPELRKTLKVLRVTGGEPLLSKNTFRLLKEMQENPLPEIELSVNSNLAVSHRIVQKFASELKKTYELARPQEIKLYTSIEAVDEKAEYIRNGLDYSLFLKNLEYLLKECPFLNVTIMSTFNLLSVTSYKELLRLVLELNAKWRNEQRKKPIWVSIVYLKDPVHLSVNILPMAFEKYFYEIRQFLEENRAVSGKDGFDSVEILSFERVYEIFMAPRKKLLEEDRKKVFYMFIVQHDHRRATNFRKIFPEYSDFWSECRRYLSLADEAKWLWQKYIPLQPSSR